jgi:hypothetical protein
MERRRLEETDEQTLKVMRRGWFLCSEAFRKELMEKAEGLGSRPTGAMRLETAHARAERIVARPDPALLDKLRSKP